MIVYEKFPQTERFWLQLELDPKFSTWPKNLK